MFLQGWQSYTQQYFRDCLESASRSQRQPFEVGYLRVSLGRSQTGSSFLEVLELKSTPKKWSLSQNQGFCGLGFWVLKLEVQDCVVRCAPVCSMSGSLNPRMEILWLCGLCFCIIRAQGR